MSGIRSDWHDAYRIAGGRRQEGRSVFSRNTDGIASRPAVDLPQDEATCGRVSTMRAICPAFPSTTRFS